MQDQIPGFFSVILNAEFIGAITAVIASTKVFRNALGNIKGVPAFILTMVISLSVGEFMYLNELGALYGGGVGILAGLVSTGVFKGTKLFGKSIVRLDKIKL